MLGFYRHSFEEQTPCLLNLGPGIAALAALGVSSAADLAAGLLRAPRQAPVAAVLLAGLVGFSERRTATVLRHAWRGPGTNDDPPAVLEPGAVGLNAAALGFTPAVAFYAWRSLFPIDTAPTTDP